MAIWVNHSLVFGNGVGADDDEIRTGNSMILDPYGRIPDETWKAGDDMVVADLDASLLEVSAGKHWIVTHRPELDEPLNVPTGMEQDTRTVWGFLSPRLRLKAGSPATA
jgi:predicted amidohydrolase